MSWCHIYYITSVILYIYSGYVAASEYYVSAAPNGESCPSTDLPCHNLSYYIADNASYFTNDAIFYFQEGTHTLQGILSISNVSNITLQGLGHIEQGFHETVMQSTSVIMCSDSNRKFTGIQFISSSDVVLESLTVANCGFNWHLHHNVSLCFLDINNVTLEYISVQNSSDYGLVLINANDLVIVNSSFANNGAYRAFVTNAYIIYADQINRLFRLFILKSNFTLALGYGMYLWCDKDNEIDVIIENSMFSNNIALYGGGVRIILHGGGSIEISNCTVYNNTAWYGGGVYIRSYWNVNIEVSNCYIYNNIAEVNGGGVSIILHGVASIEISNCTVYNNTAWYGGGVYIRSMNDNVEFSNCNIYNNIAEVNGGGVTMVTLGSGDIEFINCTIYDNTAQSEGGGVYIGLYGEIGSNVFSNCTISNNTAYFASGLVVHSIRTTSTLTSSIYFTNVSFYFNKVINGPNRQQKRVQSAVLIMNVNNVTFNQIVVSNHNTTGLLGDNSLITFDRHNMFVNNSGIYGGGIALYHYSQLLINQNTKITFINNHASESGGGIFVYHNQVLDEDITTDCSFKVVPHHDPNDTKTVLYFVNNTADISGDVLYGGKIDDCTNTLYFDHLFHYPQQTGLSTVSSDPIQVCFCETNRQNCSITNISIFSTPGIDINVSLATVGTLDGLTQGVIRLNSSDNSFIVQYNNNRLNAICTNITFILRIKPSLDTTQVNTTLETSISEPLNDPYTKVIEVTIEPCPNGYPLVNGICVCRPELNLGSITCDINTQIITRDGEMWIGYEDDSHCLIVNSNCPFHYCTDSNVNFTLSNPSKQCLYNRSGVLCGQCSEGFSLILGSNNCEQCTNDNIALIIPFALAGIALVAFVIALNLTVSVGTINGLIFYANVVKIYEPIFFNEGPVRFLSHFISWINLDLGIKTCFYNKMDSCGKMWLQFVFPAYVLFILIFIIILLRYSSKAVRLVGRQAIPVLATMILLSYTKLIRTVFQVLHSKQIPCTDSKNNTVLLLRWYIDANVEYLRGCHIPLFLFSLAVLILLIVPYTFYLLTIPLFEGALSKYMCSCQKFLIYMKPFFDAYGGPYKDRRRFWTGFLLLIRVILALVVSLDIEANASLDVLTSLLIVIIFNYRISKGIYRYYPLDYLEEFFILNLMFMAYMNVQTSNDKEKCKGQVSSIILVSISFVVFCGIIFYHVRDRLLKSRLHQSITNVKKIFKKPPQTSSSNNLELLLMHSGSTVGVSKSTSTSVVSVEMKRESILFHIDD